MLTLIYAATTLIQGRRIKNVCFKIQEQLAQKSSIAFYTLNDEQTTDGYDASLATSEHCQNRHGAKVSQLLWLYGNRRGCCVHPVQKLIINSWISFPNAPSRLPFAYDESKLSDDLHGIRKRDTVYLLLETEVEPSWKDVGGGAHKVQIEDYGKLIAWKIDSNLAILIATDIEHFTKLLIATYLQNHFLINDYLPLLRIESVTFESEPQPIALVSSHVPKSTRSLEVVNSDEWEKHLKNLRAISVLARQAIEFELNKNRSETKNVNTKPDLIPMHDETKSPKKIVTLNEATAANVSPVKQAKASEAKLQESKTIVTSKSDKKPSPTHPVTGPSQSSQSKAKPTEIKKPIAPSSEYGRFKTTKVEDDLAISKKVSEPTTKKNEAEIKKPQSKDSKPEIKSKSPSKPSELEKMAAEEKKQKSPQKDQQKTSQVSREAKDTSKVQPSNITMGASVLEKATNETKKSSDVHINEAPSSSTPSSSKETKPPALQRQKGSLTESKPLNILVYSDVTSARESVVATLKDILEPNMYTIYPLTPQQVEEKHWFDTTALVVVCGAIPTNIGEIIVHYFLCGGKILSLCSDILHFVLPTYRTAEVREHELVQFSYDKWQKVKMMHHIFCYQPSPVKKNFSTDSEESTQTMHSRKSALVCPRSLELKDLFGSPHDVAVSILGSEETWKTPSLILAKSPKTGGCAVFSQVHLETQPTEFESDDIKFSILKQNDKIRLDIFSDLLNKHLNIDIRMSSIAAANQRHVYQNAYFLGHHEAKFQLLAKLKERDVTTSSPQKPTAKIIKTSKLTMQFCGKGDQPTLADNNVLPILVHSCPEDFSTVVYFENLKTENIGRLLIYAPIVSSTMNVINELDLTHGLAVLARQQTEGVGRSNNQWLSPLGCAMFSIQLHFELSSPLGSRLPLLQHIIGLAIVKTIKSNDKYQKLDIALKWPNDIYANGINKIGGLVVKTTILGTKAIANIGCGINLDNKKPTVCLNDMIDEYNRMNKQNLPALRYEQFIALVFNEIERLIESVQSKGNFDEFYNLYYKLWLHNEQTINICDKDGKSHEAKIIGIDDFGFLKVKSAKGNIETVQPDGNSFDILKGLIVPKYN